ncbi:MAG: molybdopterin-dependent oxidoreductase [Candidatus Cloacimonetes bacterium]|jgi:DMSO/TMAO reductase YedYZ molybdopterin-dependent catalytic subunit|nr:molybdopterin-dependent oxidoreductase [Candidatus Cloacimonadota bacterium]
MTRNLICILILGLILMAQSCSGEPASDTAGKPDQTTQGDTLKSLADINTPIFWAEGHPGRLDRANWTVTFTGACERPRSFTWEELQALPQTEVDSRLTSVTRWSSRGLWKGVALSTLLAEVGVKPSCQYVRFWSVGEVYDTSIPIDIARLEKSLLAHTFNREYLDEDYGGPVRAFIPYLWGYKSAKSVVKVELMEYYVPGFWEKRGYTDSGEIEPGPCRDMNDGGAIKQIPGPGEVEF